MYDLAENDDFDRELIATYEEVSKHYPRSGSCRPLILIGAPGVGRNELVKMLVESDPEKYKCPIPCKLTETANFILKLMKIIELFQTHHDPKGLMKYQAVNIYSFQEKRSKTKSSTISLSSMESSKVICMEQLLKVLRTLSTRDLCVFSGKS